MKKGIIILVSILCFATNAVAQNKPAKKQALVDQFSGAGYGLSGCGLGSIVFGAKPGMVQVIAATVNQTGGSQTFGITSGTSNCEIPKMGLQAAVFMEVNKEIVKKDAARGEGETLVGLSNILNCKDQALFGAKVQAHYGEIFADDNSYNSVRAILNTIKTDSALSATCEIQG